MSKTHWANFVGSHFARSLYIGNYLFCERVLNGAGMKKFKKNKFLLVLAAMGPGIITAMAGNDAGGIATYSTAGANYGFATL